MLADILPTGYEVGVLNGRVRPGDTVAVVGAGPIGLSAIIGARLFSPSHVVAIDLADSRLEAAKRFGADLDGQQRPARTPSAFVRGLTDGLGADVAIEAVGVPPTFELCTQPGPTRRPRGQHRRARRAGHPAPGVAVDPRRHHHHRAGGHVLDADPAAPGRGRQIDAGRFVTHRFALDEFDGGLRRIRPGRPTPARSRSS